MVAHALAAFLAFSLAASSVYIFNDIVDLESDRKHPTKKRRPSRRRYGTHHPGDDAGARGCRRCLSASRSRRALSFALVLLAYLALTTAYTFVLKRKVLD